MCHHDNRQIKICVVTFLSLPLCSPVSVICVSCAVCSRVFIYGVFTVCPLPTGDKTWCKSGGSTRPVSTSFWGSTACRSCRSRSSLQRSLPSDIRWPTWNNTQPRAHLTPSNTPNMQNLYIPTSVMKPKLHRGSLNYRLLLTTYRKGTNHAFRVLSC